LQQFPGKKRRYELPMGIHRRGCQRYGGRTDVPVHPHAAHVVFPGRADYHLEYFPNSVGGGK
jgi:hypothetical protein